MLPVIWFCIVAVMVAIYVVLDGFDLGAGVIHLGVARTDDERRAVLQSIGPVWDGNEVWLIGRRRGIVLRLPCPVRFKLLRLLPAVDDRALAADPARNICRVPRAH